MRGQKGNLGKTNPSEHSGEQKKSRGVWKLKPGHIGERQVGRSYYK